MVQEIWDQFLTIAREEVGSRVIETWFKAIVLLRWDALRKEIYLKSPNAFIRDWMQKHYIVLLQIHLGRLVTIESPKIIFVDGIQPSRENQYPQIQPSCSSIILPLDVTPAKSALIKSHYKKPFGQSNNNNYSFNTFVVGPHNSLAYAAAHAVTEKPGKLYNPLFIYGGSGLGKTHLLHAIGNQMQQNNKSIVTLYQPADRFVSEFINAIRFDKVHRFQEKYHRVDVLLVDDVQFISNKEQTQEAFFHIFNALYESHKQIVFSSDTFPQNIKGIAERLRSRLAWGLVTDIYMPSIETKIAILKKKTMLHNETLDDDVAHCIASHMTSNVRELEGALIRVMAYASLMQEPINLELAQRVLRDHTGNSTPLVIDFGRIIKEICKHFSCTLYDLQSKSRNKDLALIRHISMFVMKSMTDKSLREIGEFFGGRDHSTVMHAIEKIEQCMRNDADLRTKIKRIQEAITQA